MKYFARTVSVLLHPLLIPLYGLVFIFNTDSIFALIPTHVRLLCYGISVVCLFLFPFSLLPLLKFFDLIKDYKFEEKQDRVYPILGTILSAFVGFYLLGKLPYTSVIQQMYLVLIIVWSTFSIITLRWKISMHMMVMGTACGFLFILGNKYLGNIHIPYTFLLLLSGILGSGELYLKKHNPAQIYTGFILGLVVVVSILY